MFNFDLIIIFIKFFICNKLFMLLLYYFILVCFCNNSKKILLIIKKISNGLYIYINWGILDFVLIVDLSLRKRYVIEC